MQSPVQQKRPAQSQQLDNDGKRAKVDGNKFNNANNEVNNELGDEYANGRHDDKDNLQQSNVEGRGTDVDQEEEEEENAGTATIDTSLFLEQQPDLQVEEDEEEQNSNESGEDEEKIYHFSPQELEILMDDARCEGFWAWMARYSRFGLGSLLNAFGVPESIWKSDLHTDARMDEQLRILKSVFAERVQRRSRLEEYHSFQHAVELIHKSKKIIVLTGAGVSVSCGIPDFRSKNGIYSRLSEFQLSDPQEMFDLEYFKFKPETFYSFAKEIYPSNFKPSPSHMFIKMLEDQGKLLRNYTQNIDTLENIAGIKNVVQCHGSFATAKCIECGHQVAGKDIEQEIFSQKVPDCKKCKQGIMKPDIVFFGENLPKTFHDCFAKDREELDLLIVMGSSLKVAPVANVMHKIPLKVPQILINMESLRHMANFDIHLLGYSDIVVEALRKSLEERRVGGGGKETCATLAAKPKPGPLPWQWLFEGAVDPSVKVVESDFSSSEGEDSDLTEDSNTVSGGEENGSDREDGNDDGTEERDHHALNLPKEEEEEEGLSGGGFENVEGLL